MRKPIAQTSTKLLSSICIILFSTIFCDAQSIFKTNRCIKVSVTENGVYKITYEDLKDWGFNDVGNISIYGNGAGEMNLINKKENPDTLHEIAIFIEKGSDNSFNSGDYILFYGQSPDVWYYDNENQKYNHKKHSYETKNYYYITDKSCSKEITSSIAQTASTYTNITSYDNFQFYENNETNPISSGRNFFESISTNKSITFSAPHVISTEKATLEVSFAARHSSSANVSIQANNATIGAMNFSAATSNKPFARLKTQSFEFTPSEKNEIAINPNYSGASSRGFLDFCTLHTRCSLQIDNNEQLLFRDFQSIKKSEHGIFHVQSKTKLTIWDITNPEMPIEIPSTFQNGENSFISRIDNLHEYIAFSSSFKSVKYEELMPQQDILSDYDVDMIVVANPIFTNYAKEICDLHTSIDGFSCITVSQEAICNEFSAGRKDIAALRNYFRYIYNKSNKRLKYVLLFGDGTYANHKIEINGPQILTFQTKESLNEDNSLCSDDFFALLDKDDGVQDNDIFVGEMDIAIGRFPVSTKTEAANITNKNIQYATNKKFRGDWQNYLCFLADDANENQTIHMSDADLLCTAINKNYPQFNFDKIYADAYKQVRSSAGERYPDVVAAINDRMQKGCLIFNYSGHGNETRMMAEYAIEASSIESWGNAEKLPFFIAAACNIAHFDYEGVSIGEKLLTQKDGGGIGMISATRYSYASANYTLCDNIYKTIFSLDSQNKPRTIGESFILAKSSTSNDYYQNKRIYTLLGDPALRLAIPQYNIVLDSINNSPIESFNDTIKALSILQIAGHIENAENEFTQNYNGKLYIKLFDKLQKITTLGNDGNDPFTFDSYTNILFQGIAEVENGKFSFQAKIPQDIYYYNGKGKLSLFATNDTIQASGYYYNLTINGSCTSIDDDFTGPEVSLYFNDTTFVNGALTNQNPTICIFVKDSSGINISNASIGHNIILTIDNDDSKQIVLNDFYYADLNSFISGQIQYKLNDLEEGPHTIKLTIWDAYNNSSETELQFQVCNSKNIKLTKLFNYPNPMSDITHFHFEHNQAGNEINVTIKIYDITGNIVTTLKKEGTPSGFNDDSFYWDGRNYNGVQVDNGIYPYTIEIHTNTGEKIYGEQKILLTK